MKARLQVTLDTTWTNQVMASVECEFDNPHSPTARALSELMVQRLKLLSEEIRHANERTIPDLLDESRAGSEGDREQRAHEDLRREREREDAQTSISRHG